MSVILIEGPDKCGKTTLVKSLTTAGLLPRAKHLPDGPFRPLVIDGAVTGLASTFLFFANEQQFWQDYATTPGDFVCDRGMISMLVYQGYLLGNMPPIVILNLYKTIMTDLNITEIVYLTNEPFEEYDDNDLFEAYGYTQIRACYEDAIKLVESNFADIKITRLDLSVDTH